MKALVQDKYGDLDELRVEEIDQPRVGDDEVLVRVRAASVHPDVWHVLSGRPYAMRLMGSGLRRPKNRVPGTDMAGVVEAVGGDVTGLLPGDDVFGETVGVNQWTNGGAFAEYVSVPQDALALKPENISFEQAATVPTAGLIVLLNLRGQSRIKPGQRVLVNGAGGGVGTIALQLAKAYGATVTGVDHTDKLDMITSLGADHVIDYTKEDFTRGSERYDLIFDIPGNHPFSACKRALSPEGTYVLIGHENFGKSGHRLLGILPSFFKLLALALFVKQMPKPNFSLPSKKDSMATLKGFLEDGSLTPIVDRTYALNEVPAAVRYLSEGTARGRIVITPTAG